MPDILTASSQTDYLTDEAYQHSELELLIQKAERKVLNRYREVAGRSDDLILEDHYDSGIRLDGYVEADDETIDLQESDAALVDSLRAAVANIVEFWVDKPDEAEHVSRRVQGDRTVEFRDAALPSSVFAPLRSWDRRRAWY